MTPFETAETFARAVLALRFGAAAMELARAMLVTVEPGVSVFLRPFKTSCMTRRGPRCRIDGATRRERLIQIKSLDQE